MVASRGQLLTVGAWSDDRARIYYDVVNVTSEYAVSGVRVDSVRQGGGGARRERGAASDLDVSRSGDRLVHTRQEGRVSNVFTSDAAGRGERRVTGAGGISPRFSADGRRIVFSRFLPTGDISQYEVFTVRTDGTGLTRVTGDRSAQDIGGGFSPDGRRVLFTRYSVSGSGVYSVGIDGRGLRLVRANATDPDWAANGWISYLTSNTPRPDGQGQRSQITLRAPGLRGAETVLIRERNLITGVRFAG